MKIIFFLRHFLIFFRTSDFITPSRIRQKRQKSYELIRITRFKLHKKYNLFSSYSVYLLTGQQSLVSSNLSFKAKNLSNNHAY